MSHGLSLECGEQQVNVEEKRREARREEIGNYKVMVSQFTHVDDGLRKSNKLETDLGGVGNS